MPRSWVWNLDSRTLTWLRNRKPTHCPKVRDQNKQICRLASAGDSSGENLIRAAAGEDAGYCYKQDCADRGGGEAAEEAEGYYS